MTIEGAYARWQEHRATFGEAGLWPVIVPGEHAAMLEGIFAERSESVEEDVAKGLCLDVGEYFSGALNETLEGFDEDEEGEAFKPKLDFEPPAPKRESWPPVEGQIAALGELTQFNGAKEALWIALVPCREPWEVPAVLSYGGWNACPMPAEHVAVFREWHARHGAEPLVIGGDTVELLVRPLEDPAEAKRIAIEQYAYCSDIVDQGTGSVETLAAELLGASVWFFWWD